MKRASKQKKKNRRKKKINKTSLVCDEICSLPNDILIGILSRLRIEWVMRCKSVCKHWNSLIKEADFMDKHVDRWRKKSAYCSFSWSITGGPNLDEEYQIIAEAHGVLVERSSYGEQYRVRNPTTRLLLYLPNPRFTTNHQMALCYDYITKIYKLISVYYYEDDSKRAGGCEILTLGGATLSWRTLDIPSLKDVNHERDRIGFNTQIPDMYTFHLMRARGNLGQVISIRLHNEKVFVSDMPQDMLSNVVRLTPYWYYTSSDEYGGSEDDDCDWEVSPGFADIEWDYLRIVFLNPAMRFYRLTDLPLLFFGREEAKQSLPLFWFKGFMCFMNERQIFGFDLRIMSVKKFNVVKFGTTQPNRQHSGTYTLLHFQGMQPA